MHNFPFYFLVKLYEIDDRGVHRVSDDEGCSCLIHNDSGATSDYLVAVPGIKNGFKGF